MKVENPMLDPNGYDYFKREIDDGAKICPICGDGKFRDNAICYQCRTLIREQFVLEVWNTFSKRVQNKASFYDIKQCLTYIKFRNNWSRSDRSYIDDEVEDLLDIL